MLTPLAIIPIWKLFDLADKIHFSFVSFLNINISYLNGLTTALSGGFKASIAYRKKDILLDM